LSIDGNRILSIEMVDNDANADTIRDYLKVLLSTLWEEGESFSGKRPFGNSGWEYELLDTLEIHDIPEQDRIAAIFEAIEAL